LPRKLRGLLRYSNLTCQQRGNGNGMNLQKYFFMNYPSGTRASWQARSRDSRVE